VFRGYAQLLEGAPKAAHEAFESLAAINERWPTTWLHRARGSVEVGELEVGAERAGRCLALAPPRAVLARALGVLGLARGLGAGAREDADRTLAEALDLCDALGLRPYLAETHEFMTEVCARRGDAEGASRHAALARETYARCGMTAHARRVRR
jgi:hypothetical protein